MLVSGMAEYGMAVRLDTVHGIQAEAARCRELAVRVVFLAGRKKHGGAAC